MASKLEDTLAFQIKAAGLPEPTRELVFAPPRRWRFDFSWHLSDPWVPLIEVKVAVEVDGGTRSGGRHVRGDGYEKDAEKLNEAGILGWTVIRVTKDMVEDGRALRYVQRALGMDLK